MVSLLRFWPRCFCCVRCSEHRVLDWSRRRVPRIHALLISHISPQYAVTGSHSSWTWREEDHRGGTGCSGVDLLSPSDLGGKP